MKHQATILLWQLRLTGNDTSPLEADIHFFVIDSCDDGNTLATIVKTTAHF